MHLRVLVRRRLQASDVMKQHLKYRPYIRRHRRGDRSMSFRVAFRLAFYEQLGRPFYVMVQRGFSRDVMACDRSRAALEKSLLWLEVRRKYGARFKDYARRLQAQAQGVEIRDYQPRIRAAAKGSA